MDKEDWNKYVKVFNLDVDVTVRKEVTKADVLLALLDKNEIAFKGEKGCFVMKINDEWDLELIEKIIIKPILDSAKELKDKKKGVHK